MEGLPTELLERIVGLLEIQDRIRFCLATSKTILNRLDLSSINSSGYDTNDTGANALFRRHEVTVREDQLDQYLGFCRGRHITHAKRICIISSTISDTVCDVEDEEEDDGATTVVLRDLQGIGMLLQRLLNCESETSLRIHTLVINRTQQIEHEISFHDFAALKNLKILGWQTTIVLEARKLPVDLEKLSLSKTYIATYLIGDLPIVSLHNLKSLEFRHCYCHSSINAWLKSAILCSSLEKLVISSCNGTRDRYAVDQRIDASHCKNLRHLEVRDLAWNPVRMLHLPVGIQHVDVRKSGIDTVSIPWHGSHLKVLKISSLNIFLDEIGNRCKQIWVPAEYLFRIPAEVLSRLTEIDIEVHGQQWCEYIEQHLFLPLLNLDHDKVCLNRCTFHMNQSQTGSRSEEQVVSSSLGFLNLLAKVTSRLRCINISFED
jgi:hypothetical protein